MADFVNVKKNLEAEVLSKEEISVLLEVVRFSLGPNMEAAAGTFVLDGQANDNKAECLLRFDLPLGDYATITSITADGMQRTSTKMTSGELAELSIDEVLEWPKGQIFRSLLDKYDSTEQIPTGIYGESEFLVLVLNTDNGRFLMSLELTWTDDCEKSEGCARMIMHLLAKTLGEMRPEDKVLQESLEELDKKLPEMRRFGESLEDECWVAWICIGCKLETCDEPVFRAWKDWRERASMHSEMTTYFQ